MRKAKFNPIVEYEEVQVPESSEALNLAYKVLFEEVMKDRKGEEKVSNSDQKLPTSMI